MDDLWLDDQESAPPIDTFGGSRKISRAPTSDPFGNTGDDPFGSFGGEDPFASPVRSTPPKSPLRERRQAELRRRAEAEAEIKRQAELRKRV